MLVTTGTKAPNTENAFLGTTITSSLIHLKKTSMLRQVPIITSLLDHLSVVTCWLLQELFVCSDLGNSASLHKGNQIRISHGSKAMSDNNGCHIAICLEKFVQSILNGLL